MPIFYEKNNNGGILIKGEGLVTAKEIKELNDSLYDTPENILKIKYQLWDLSNVSESQIPSNDIEVFVKQDKAAAEINPNMIIVIAGNNDLIFSLARMWEILSCGSHFKSMVFRNITDAEKWIEEQMKP